MRNEENGGSVFTSDNECRMIGCGHSTLKLELPSAEEIARAIWQRQHDALVSDSISHRATWRDPSVPYKFWDEFLLDARAVILLLKNRQSEREKQASTKSKNE
jgi:hypothetical protein